MIFDELMTGLNEVVGMESYSGTQMTELEEMNAEIQDMIALESALDEEVAYSTLEFCDNAESISALLAMRECGLESTQGMNPTKIYEGFGFESDIAMEAAKDVLARKAYAGTAAIKALISTCIKWLKSLFGITVASKKIFKSLESKAKAMKKQLNKKRGSAKINSDKLKRDLPSYSTSLNSAMQKYDDILKKVASTGHLASIKSGTDDAKKFDNDISAVKTITDELKDVYDKSNTEEKTGNDLITTLVNSLGTIEGLKGASGSGRVEDAGKYINDAIKELEKYRKTLDNRTNDETNEATNAKQKAALNRAIALYNQCATASKGALKEVVKISDDCLTMAKGVLAAIY